MYALHSTVDLQLVKVAWDCLEGVLPAEHATHIEQLSASMMRPHWKERSWPSSHVFKFVDSCSAQCSACRSTCCRRLPHFDAARLAWISNNWRYAPMASDVLHDCFSAMVAL